jgi:hypothetical protein
MKISTLFLCLSLLFLTTLIYAQDVVQDVKGRIGDQQSRSSLANAEVELLYFNPQKVSISDSLGNFNLKDVPVGRHRLLVKAEGYKEVVINDLIVTSGKEVFLQIYLDEELEPEKLSTVNPSAKRYVSRIKDDATNTMVDVSSQSFSLDEVNRYSGSRSDIARLVTGFAGIINPDDARNDIISRGATSLGIQWRLEGVPVGNPNHFGYLSTSAGYFPIININMMANSDFLYGNMSAEYGNSTSGTFDINLRKGNANRTEFTGQFALNGGELMLEGPLSRTGGNASYIVGARYSVLKLFDAMGVDLGTNSLPDYFDINFNIYLQDNKKRKTNIFGIYGYSQIFTPFGLNEEDDLVTIDANKDISVNIQNGTLGISHREILNRKTYWHTSLAGTGSYEWNYSDFYIEQPDSSYYKYRGSAYRLTHFNYVLNSYLNTKVSRKLNFRTGITAQYRQMSLQDTFNRYDTLAYLRHDYQGSQLMLEAYGQMQYKFSNRLRTNIGLHGQFFSLNNSWALEPRFALIWDPSRQHRISIGYAWQSSELPYRLYFQQFPVFDSTGAVGSYQLPHTNLDLLRNHYVTLEYIYKITESWQLELMPYFRYWTSVPVEANQASGFSFINYASEEFTDYMPLNPLESSGTATNYGIDLTLRKYFSAGFYAVANASWLNSTYKGSDNIERNSRFNRRYIARLLGGKEFKVGKQKNNVLFLNTTITYAGGGFATPLDLVASAALQDEVFSANYFSSELEAYLRIDFKVGMRINSRRKRISHYFFIDAMNVLGRANQARFYYDTARNVQGVTPQIGFLPDLLYRIQF